MKKIDIDARSERNAGRKKRRDSGEDDVSDDEVEYIDKLKSVSKKSPAKQSATPQVCLQ